MLSGLLLSDQFFDFFRHCFRQGFVSLCVQVDTVGRIRLRQFRRIQPGAAKPLRYCFVSSREAMGLGCFLLAEQVGIEATGGNPDRADQQYLGCGIIGAKIALLHHIHQSAGTVSNILRVQTEVRLTIVGT